MPEKYSGLTISEIVNDTVPASNFPEQFSTYESSGGAEKAFDEGLMGPAGTQPLHEVR